MKNKTIVTYKWILCLGMTFFLSANLSVSSAVAKEGCLKDSSNSATTFKAKWQDKSIALTKYITIWLNGEEAYVGTEEDKEDSCLDDRRHSFAMARLKDKAILRVIWSDEVDFYLVKYFVVSKQSKGEVFQVHKHYGHRGHVMFIHDDKIYDFKGTCWSFKPCHERQKLFVFNEETRGFEEVKLDEHNGKRCLPEEFKDSCVSNRLDWDNVEARPVYEERVNGVGDKK